LRDGKQLTRAELAQTLRGAGIDVTGSQRLAHMLLRPELDGIICSGARRGKQMTYALLEERVPPAPAKGRDEALLELTTRYFSTRGPATLNDFAWWSGLTVADARRGTEMAGASLERTVIGERAYWAGPPTRVATRKTPHALLLPNYDEYFIGLKDRSAIGTRLRSAGLVTGGDALIAYVVVVDGQLVGGWKRTATKASVAIELRLITPLSRAEQAAVAAAAQRHGEFIGLPVALRGLSASRGRRRARS
jgi:hypothetical protein